MMSIGGEVSYLDIDEKPFGYLGRPTCDRLYSILGRQVSEGHRNKNKLR